MSRFSREQLETLTKVFEETKTNHVPAAGGVTVRNLALTALDALDRIATLEGLLQEAAAELMPYPEELSCVYGGSDDHDPVECSICQLYGRIIAQVGVKNAQSVVQDVKE